MESQNAPDAESVKFKGITLAIRSSFSVSEPIGIGDANGRRDMVSKALSEIDELAESCGME
jgi:hypothetical protein